MNYNTWEPKKYIPKTNNNEDKISPVEEPQIVDTHSDINTENIDFEVSTQNTPPSTIVLTEDNIEKQTMTGLAPAIIQLILKKI